MMEFAGTLRERVVIEKPVSSRNAMGLQESGWEQVCRCLASVVLESVGAESEAQALSAMPRVPSSAACFAAANVPECHIEFPRL